MVASHQISHEANWPTKDISLGLPEVTLTDYIHCPPATKHHRGGQKQLVLSCGGYVADKIISVPKRQEGGRERERGRDKKRWHFCF